MSSSSAAPELKIVEERSVDPSANATATAFDPTQGVMAVGYSTGTVSLFAAKYPTNSQLRSGHSSPITHLKFIPGHAALASLDEQGMLRIFDLDTLGFCFEYKVPIAPTCMGIFAGTSWLLVGTEGGRVYFVDAVNGRKSDFSIGCLTKPVSPVVAVESHPIEAEKILIAYSEGTCVVCDIGKASVSEKAMVLSKHRFEHPEALRQPVQGSDSAHAAELADPWLLCAGWSPTGDRFAATYSNGVVAVFGPDAGPAPVVARTIQCPDIQQSENAIAAAAAMDRKLRSLKHVRWCTYVEQNQSFLVVTSGSTPGFQSHIHILGTKTRESNIKSSRDITTADSYETESHLVAFGTIPSQSPWRNGNDRLCGLVVLSGRQTYAQVLQIQPDLRILRLDGLPGELDWCIAPAISQFCAEGELSTAVGNALRQLLQCNIPPAANSTSVDISKAAKHPTNISQLYCCVDDSNILSLWCTASNRLYRCKGIGLDLVYLSRLVGAEGQITSASLCALNGMLAIGTSTGETFICMLSGDLWAPLAQTYTPFEDLREAALKLYSQQPKELLASITPQPTRPQSAHTDVTLSKQAASVHRIRSASLHEGNIFRRKSKRLSSSFGTLFRRGSSASGHLKSESKQSMGSDDALEASARNLLAAVSSAASIESDLTRPPHIDSGAWGEQLDRFNAEMSPRVYGIRFGPDEQHRLAGSHRLDSKSPEQSEPQSQLYLLPFMLARFACCRVANVVAGQNGMIAVLYNNGAVVVIDAIGQCVVLVDNINLAPASGSTVGDIFGESAAESATITATAFATASDGREQLLLVGTSRGHVYRYYIHDRSLPPKVVARAVPGPVVYLALESCGNSSTDQKLLVVGMPVSVSLHPGMSSKPAAVYQLADTKSHFVSMRVVQLASGWHGIATVDSQARVILLSLPDLSEAANLVLSEDARNLVRADNVCIGDSGQVQILGPSGRLVQVHVAARAGELDVGCNVKRSYFDPSLLPTAQPTRTGITSWLLGKATDPSADIDAFLGSHCRDLLSSGGVKPGARLRQGPEPAGSEAEPSMINERSRKDSKISELDRSLNAGEFAETKEMLEKRGQQLDDASEAVQQLSIQSEGFLKKIRAYNAEQEKKSKRRFGLF